jgi:hypothetical protein
MFGLSGPARAARRYRAFAIELPDPVTGATGALAALKEAGFEAAELPLDRSPLDLSADLILVGSFVWDTRPFQRWIRAHGEAIREWIRGGGVWLEMAQPVLQNPAPPHAEEGLDLRRYPEEAQIATVRATRHPLTDGLPSFLGEIHFESGDGPVGGHILSDLVSFLVLIAAGKTANRAVLVEGALGSGRVLVSSMLIDRREQRSSGGTTTPVGSPAYQAFSRAFFANLARYVDAVRKGRAPVVSTAALPPIPFEPGSWTLVVLPDTQLYAKRVPGLFTLQTQWIVDNAKALDIRFVAHVGDLTNDNTPEQWDRVRESLSRLQGRVPFAITTGNHDYGQDGSSLINERLDFATLCASATFGGAMKDGEIENNWHQFEAGGVRWLVLSLEWAPTPRAVAWADEVMRAHPEHRGILVTHGYLDERGRRYDAMNPNLSQAHSPRNMARAKNHVDGEALWNKLVKKHDFAFVFCGHETYRARSALTSLTDRGRPCFQLMQNFQIRPLGGEGYLILYEFQPDGKTVVVKTYSPLLDVFITLPDYQFILELET